jgi:hypothetical protein
MIDFAIMICSYGDIKDGTVQSLEIFRKYTNFRYEVRILSGDALIGRSRSRICTQFLKCNDTPYMIFIDSDILFSPGDIEDIYRALMSGKHCVAGAYSVANGAHLAIRTYGEQIVFDGSVQEVEYASTGFMGISRVLLEKIKDTLPLLHPGSDMECYPFFESGRTEKHPDFYISEDWNFCDKTRDVQEKVYLHTGVLVGHIKNAVIRAGDVIDRQMKKEG